jgi:uroporphyrin-III C-methyltransferase/precorrin-2 dehydrogenase/sirohydrochlorin ferrochelatase
MGLRNLETLTTEFIVRGASPDLPAAIVDNATRPQQRVIVATLSTLAAKAQATGLKGPAIVIVGTVVTLRDRLAAAAVRTTLQAKEAAPAC